MNRWPSLLVVPAFLALAIVMTWPLVREIAHHVPTVAGQPDALLQGFILNWDLRTLVTHPLDVLNLPIYHPERNALTYTDMHFGEALVAAPAAALTRNPAVAYNSVVFFACVASAWAMYRLVRLFGISRAGAFVCGLLFAFGPYRFGSMANLNLLQTEWIPLGLFFAFRAAWRGRTRDLMAAGLVLALQSYFSWYYTFYLATALALFVAYRLAGGWLRPRELVGRRALGVVAVLALAVLPTVLPYVVERLTVSGFRRTLGMAAVASADVFDYLRVNVQNRLLGGVPWLSGDQPYWPGTVAVTLAVLGVWAARRGAFPARAADDGPPSRSEDSSVGRRPRGWPAARAWLRRTARRWRAHGYFLLLAASGFVISLGPILHVGGLRLPVPLPYAVMFFVVPGYSSMRAPGRCAVLVLTAVVALAGFGYEWCRRRAPAGAGRTSLFAGTSVLALGLAWSVPFPLVRFPMRADMPPIYRWLAAQPDSPPMLDLPVPRTEADEGDRDVTRQIYALYHRKPLVNGTSGFVPPRHQAMRYAMQRFPAQDALRAAAALGTRIVIVHYGDWPPATAARLRRAAARAPGLEQVAAFGDDVAYVLEPSPR